jgi:hypothetical protein
MNDESSSIRFTLLDLLTVVTVIAVGLALARVVTPGVVLGVAAALVFFRNIAPPPVVDWTAVGGLIGSLTAAIFFLRTGGDRPVVTWLLCAIPLLLGMLYGLRKAPEYLWWAMSGHLFGAISGVLLAEPIQATDGLPPSHYTANVAACYTTAVLFFTLVAAAFGRAARSIRQPPPSNGHEHSAANDGS